MTSYGVTDAGFVLKPLDQIKSDVEARLRANIDAGLNLTASSPDGQFFQIICELISQMWELAQAVGATWDPDEAVGVWIENLAAITGTIKEDAKASTATVTITTTAAVSVDVGTFVLSVAGNSSAHFANTEAIVTTGADALSIAFAAQSTGPTVANAGTLTVIETPVTGIASATNPLDAEIGSDIESDDALRVRRENELDAVGAGTLDSIRARLIKPLAEGGAGCTDAEIFENTSDVTDGSGRPPHSIQAVVLGGVDADIWQAIWAVAGGGIQTFGAQTGSATDSRGKLQSVSFDRAVEKDVYLEIDLDIIADNYPSDGDTQIKDLIVAQGSTLTLGGDVIAERLKAAALPVSGIYDITGFRLGFAASPTGTANLAIGETELAVFDTSRVVVTTTPVTP